MRVKGLDGKEYILNFSKCRKADGESKYHLRAREILQMVYPLDARLEEVPILGFSGRPLYLDFFLPLRKLAVEVQGEQHYSFNIHMHGSRVGFMQSKVRDRKKSEWCELNGFTLIELPWSESDGQWTERIKNAVSG